MSSEPSSRTCSRAWIAALAAFTVAAVASCAQVGNPPGGPVDQTPPRLLEAQPGSLAVGVPPDEPLRLVFSERVERRGLTRSIRFIPDVVLEDPEFEDTAVSLTPRDGWPPDTVVVWTVQATMKDKHGVALESLRSGAFTTAARMPPGAVRGRVQAKDEEADLGTLRVNLELPPPEGSRRRSLWRFGGNEGSGTFSLGLLEVPSGPFFLEAFLDANGNGSRDAREPVATVDSLFLAPPDSILNLGVLDLVDLEGPVATWVCLPAAAADSLVRIVYFLPTSGENTRPSTAPVDSTGCAGPQSLTPGPYQVGGWLDADEDGRFGADSLGVSEPFLPVVEWEVRPEQPDTVRLGGEAMAVLEWATLDTLSAPPVPSDLFAQ